uniref:Protein MEMO1 n=1 Tax=Trieres chinensis TaxID=1514140 RepID=A0A7S1YYW4_TRICV|mmetsp:Transcript_13556/g.27975  ORF Transcript_13556/g.27975 Transcript_13556/m.27975 type:complete len:391 (+) Transcript_13556:323-1495(+)
MGGTSSSSHPSSSAAALLSRKSAASAPSASGGRSSDKDRGGDDGSYVRRAHHAGSWYESSPSDLDWELSGYLRDADGEGGGTEGGVTGRPRAVVSPHAGFRYSGPTAAYAYLALREALRERGGGSASAECEKGGNGENGSNGPSLSRPIGGVSTVVVLHPSHHVRLRGCAVSGASMLETPIANLPVDCDLRSELLGTGHFTVMERHVDEAEHSGEMQYPFIAKAIADAGADSGDISSCRVLPIMVGALDTAQESHFGQILAPYLARPDIFTVISSDFCHWGRRFGYVPSRSEESGRCNEIADFIEWLDRRGMDYIQSQAPGAFAEYLRRYSNTICGRHPIGVWLNAITTNRESETECLDVKFVRYAQSGRVKSFNDSSVSYASAVARVAA